MRIRELHILTSSLSGTKKFYCDTLQLGLVEESVDHFSIQLGYSLLVFHSGKEKSPVYHIALNIPSNKIREALTWIGRKADLIPLDQNKFIADFSNWDAEAIYFFDNNNNILELIGRRGLHNESVASFGPGSILSLSEAGIVVDDVIQTCNYFNEHFGLRYFSRQPPSDHFAALGDDEGLFIIVSKNRNWYPTTIPSAAYWFRVVFEQNGNRFTCEPGKTF